MLTIPFCILCNTGGSQVCHQECFDLKEAVKALTELAIQDTKIPTLPAKSSMVTGLNCIYCTKGHHIQVITQSQQLVTMINAGTIPMCVIMELFHIIVRHIMREHYCISELLSPIVDVVNNVEDLLVIKNINSTLCRFIVEVLRMSVC